MFALQHVPQIMILKTVQASVAEKFNPLSSESIWTLSDMLLLVQQIWKHFSFIPGSAFNYRDTIILNISSYEDFPPGFTKGSLLKCVPILLAGKKDKTE